MEFVILCGGYGTRFQKVSKIIPKILVEISEGITMMDWLLDEYLPKNSKVILATGHLHKIILQYVEKRNYKANILFSQEKTKLGTGGAIINACNLVNADEFIVLNGDTIQEVKMSDFIKESTLEGNSVINIGCSKSNNDDSGRIIINNDNLILNFSEKKKPLYLQEANLKLCSSLGMYRCRTEYFKKLEKTYISLEEEILPQLVADKKAYASIFSEKYHDFGTLERYQEIISKRGRY